MNGKIFPWIGFYLYVAGAVLSIFSISVLSNFLMEASLVFWLVGLFLTLLKPEKDPGPEI